MCGKEPPMEHYPRTEYPYPGEIHARKGLFQKMIFEERIAKVLGAPPFEPRVHAPFPEALDRYVDVAHAKNWAEVDS